MVISHFLSELEIFCDKSSFNSASAQMLISELIVCNAELERMREQIISLQTRVNTVIGIMAKV